MLSLLCALAAFMLSKISAPGGTGIRTGGNQTFAVAAPIPTDVCPIADGAMFPSAEAGGFEAGEGALPAKGGIAELLFWLSATIADFAYDIHGSDVSFGEPVED